MFTARQVSGVGGVHAIVTEIAVENRFTRRATGSHKNSAAKAPPSPHGITEVPRPTSLRASKHFAVRSRESQEDSDPLFSLPSMEIG